MGRKIATVVGTLGVLVAGFILISVMGQMRPKIERQEPEKTPAAVLFATATPQQVTLDVFAQGEVSPRTDIMLTAQVSGKIVATSAEFVNGGAFEENDLLIDIEDDDYRYAVTGARSRVAQAKEILTREQAEANLAEQDYQELGDDTAASDLALRKPQLAQARANYDAAVADLKTAQLNLQRTKLKAPFKGRVRERLVGPGQFVSPGAQLGRLFSTDIAEIRLPLSDADLAKLGLPVAFVASDDNKGPTVELSALLAGRLHQWTGTIARTDGAIDPTTRQISAIAVVEDPYGASADNGTPLAIGLFVDAKIKGKPYDNAFVVPRKAIYGRDTLYIIGQGDVLEERTVTIVSSDRDTVTVSEGVAPGDRIVVSPLRGARDGDEVAPEAAALANPSRLATNEDPTPVDVSAPPLNKTPAIKKPVVKTDASLEEPAPKVSAQPVQEDFKHSPKRQNPDNATPVIKAAHDPASTQAPAQPPAAPKDTIADGGSSAPYQYKPGERAPNDEVADDLNRQQLNAASGDIQ